MRAIYKLRDYLLENYVDEYGDLVLSWLDFSEFDGDVYIDCIKVKGNLFQCYQEVQGDLFQNYQKVQGNLIQSHQEVQGNLYQDCQKVQGNLIQSHQEVKGYLIHGATKYGGELIEYPYSKMLKEITLDELEELGYKLKE